MQYTFYILTNDGLKSGVIQSNTDFSCAPFGFVPYRKPSSCECSPEILDDFWNCIDAVLAQNNLTSIDFIRAVRAEVDNTIYGEIHTHI